MRGPRLSCFFLVVIGFVWNCAFAELCISKKSASIAHQLITESMKGRSISKIAEGKKSWWASRCEVTVSEIKPNGGFDLTLTEARESDGVIVQTQSISLPSEVEVLSGNLRSFAPCDKSHAIQIDEIDGIGFNVLQNHKLLMSGDFNLHNQFTFWLKAGVVNLGSTSNVQCSVY